jgi:site-specific DNA recombinase
MQQSKPALQRCAIYTRKSSEEGLEQEFNSLHAQREACESFIKSQAGEGWRLIKTAYDDGGLSGATMERPALQRLMADLNQGSIDVVVVYKVDRLTRSLADFAKMVEAFDAHEVSFVSVTQQFNTTTSMGRLTLNVLLSFAQFEREVTGERIRDKIAASKRKGMWMGGLVPLGYDVRNRHLVVNQAEAATVREIFRCYLELGNVRLLRAELDRRGSRSKVRVANNGIQSGGRSFHRGALYTVLRNPIYIGQIRHKGLCHPGEHQAIIEMDMWERVQTLLSARRTRGTERTTKSTRSPLTKKLFDESGDRLTPSHAVKGTRRYRYYVSHRLTQGRANQPSRGWRLPAAEIERIVAGAARCILDDGNAILDAVQAAEIASNEIPEIMHSANTWSRRLESPAECSLALAELVDRVELSSDGIRLALKVPTRLAHPAAPEMHASITVSRFVPMQIKRRGVELRLVMNSNRGKAQNADPALLKAIARAHRWFDDLVTGRVSSMAEIGKREGLPKNYVSWLIRLAFLAPEIVEAIVQGNHPPELTAQALITRRIDLPLQGISRLRPERDENCKLGGRGGGFEPTVRATPVLRPVPSTARLPLRANI